MMRPPGGGGVPITAAQPTWPTWPTWPRGRRPPPHPLAPEAEQAKNRGGARGTRPPILRVQLKIPPLLRGGEAITEVLQRFLPRPSFKGRAVPRTSDQPAPPPPRLPPAFLGRVGIPEDLYQDRLLFALTGSQSSAHLERGACDSVSEGRCS